MGQSGRSIRVLLLLCSWVVALRAANPPPPPPRPPIPSAQQVAWQRCETNMFLHFGVNTFTNREWGDGKEDPKIFNPTQLDARQWARVAREGGFKIVILTAKHHDGFCLWPSRYTDHSVRSSPWRGGKGDVVRELAEACRIEGLKLGLYLSPWDRHEKTYGDSPRYNEFYRNQMTELMTQYGPIAEVWFDGACGEGPNGRRQEYDWEGYRDIVRRHQPEAVMFSDAGPDVRWIGNERGIAGDPCWAPIRSSAVPFPGAPGAEIIKFLQHGDPVGDIWRPGESDVSIRPGWFWHAKEDEKVRSVDNLVDLYFQSVGRNSLLLLNVPPNDKGLISDADAQRLKDFRARLNQIFSQDLAAGRKAKASQVRGGTAQFAPGRTVDHNPETFWATDDGVTSGWLEVDLGAEREIGFAGIQEAIRLGQRVEAYHIEYWNGRAWKAVAGGTTIGNKRLNRFDHVRTRRVRLVIDKSLACPLISTFSVW